MPCFPIRRFSDLGWPGALRQVPPMSDSGLALSVLGGLWLGLGRRPWRWAALLPILRGALSPLTVEPPHLLGSDDARQVAVRDGEESSWGGPSGAGRLWVASRRTDRFVLDTWARQAFVAETLARPRFGAAAEGKLRCDPLGCL